MAIAKDQMLGEMLKAAQVVLAENWPQIKLHAEVELKKIVEEIALIERLRNQDAINRKQAKLLIAMKKNTAQIVLSTVEGMTVSAVEEATNAALRVVEGTVNRALGFDLL